MTYILDEFGARKQFDVFCKVVLRHEAINYFRELNRQRKRAIQFSALSQHEMDELCTVDEYPSDKFAFSAFGYSYLFKVSWAQIPFRVCRNVNSRF